MSNSGFIRAIPSMISTVSLESVGGEIRYVANTTFNSGAWPTANKAIFVPFTIRYPITVTMLWTSNGTNASQTRDIGIYDRNGTLIVSSGSTAGSGTTTLQTYNIADTVIGPGTYYLALASSGTTNQFLSGGPVTRITQTSGVYEKTTAFPLPATVTFSTVSQGYLPLIGLATVTTV